MLRQPNERFEYLTIQELLELPQAIQSELNPKRVLEIEKSLRLDGILYECPVIGDKGVISGRHRIQALAKVFPRETPVRVLFTENPLNRIITGNGSRTMTAHEKALVKVSTHSPTPEMVQEGYLNWKEYTGLLAVGLITDEFTRLARYQIGYKAYTSAKTLCRNMAPVDVATRVLEFAPEVKPYPGLTEKARYAVKPISQSLASRVFNSFR